MSAAKFFPWLMAGLPLVAVICYMTLSDQGHSLSKAGAITHSKVTDKKMESHVATAGKRKRELTPEEILAYKKFQETRQRATQSFQKVASHMTPEYCENMADHILANRRGNYAKILDSWNLDDAKAREVHEIIRSREIRRLQNTADHFKDAYNKKNIKTKSYQNQAEDMVAVETLALSIGEKRAKDLLDVMRQEEKSELESLMQQDRKR